MADSLKVEYMGKPTIGFSTYYFTNAEAKDAQSPVPGDIGIVIDEGKIYFCVNKNEWLPFGGNQ